MRLTGRDGFDSPCRCTPCDAHWGGIPHDEDDIRYLLRHLNLDSYEAALEVIARFYPLERFPQKTLYALEQMLDETNSG